MEYERIHKVQSGMISPSKLRMKLMGSPNLRKKDGSNSNSSRTSPSKLDDSSDFVKNSLLANEDQEVSSPCLQALAAAAAAASDRDSSMSVSMTSSSTKENDGLNSARQSSKSDSTGNSSSVHQARAADDDNLDYDSNASSSSFEFHRGERSSVQHGHVSRGPLQRHVPSKWNDAEKWLVNRQSSAQPKRHALQNQTNRMAMVKVAPEMFGKAVSDTKRVDFCQSTLQVGPEKFSFGHAASQSKDSEEPSDLPEEATGVPAIRSVSMRDMGTEMTPATSLEPSMTSTPVGASTPIRSPISSMPSTPRAGAPASSPVHADESQVGGNKRELSEEELKLKTRREIMALGVQLGKMNIAAWASKDEQEKKRSRAEATAEAAQIERAECEKRAIVWEEAEKTKHTARYKREEIKIQAWESEQRAKLEAELRRIEAQVEQMRAQGKAKMVKKIAMTRQRSEEKRSSAEAKKIRDAERVAAQAEYIRQTGRAPSSPSQYLCCGLL